MKEMDRKGEGTGKKQPGEGEYENGKRTEREKKKGEEIGSGESERKTEERSKLVCASPFVLA